MFAGRGSSVPGGSAFHPQATQNQTRTANAPQRPGQGTSGGNFAGGSGSARASQMRTNGGTSSAGGSHAEAVGSAFAAGGKVGIGGGSHVDMRAATATQSSLAMDGRCLHGNTLAACPHR